MLPHEYPELQPSEVQIVLLEGGDRLLPAFPPRLSAYARRELVRHGVDVRLDEMVADAGDAGVRTRGGDEIPTATLVWTAGVRPSELVEVLDAPRTVGHRFEVDGHLRILGVEHAYAVGDSAAGRDGHGRELPMVSPPAMQEGRYVARDILRHGRQRPFRYRDKGMLATIGRTAAVGRVARLGFTGFVGWVVWLVVHLYYLIGFENRVRVVLRWAWYYLRYDRPVRSVIRAGAPPGNP